MMLWTAVPGGSACRRSQPGEPKPAPVTPTKPDNPDTPTPPEDKDAKAPEITLKLTEVNVYSGKTITLESGKLSIGGTESATWTDDKSSADKCTVSLSLDGAAIKSGE